MLLEDVPLFGMILIGLDSDDWCDVTEFSSLLIGIWID